MKKIASIAAIALFGAMAMTSCKKDYTCTCTYNIAGQTTSTDFSLGKQKKKDAEAACSARVSTLAGTSVSCNLK